MALLKAQQTADDRRWAGLGLRIDLERHLVAADARVIGCASGKTDLGLGQIVEAGGGDAVIDLEAVALAPAIGSLDKQNATFACQDLGELDHWCPRVKRRLGVRTL